MASTPNPPSPDQVGYKFTQPLDPTILLALPPDSFRDPLPTEVGRACDAWYDLVDLQAFANLRPEVIDVKEEPGFAHFVAKVVSENVGFDANHRRHPVFDPREVTSALTRYYIDFAPSNTPSQVRRERQDQMMPYAFAVRERYLEVGVVLGIQRACVARRNRTASRATYALLTAYGTVAQPMVK